MTNRIKQIRLEKGISQKRLADLLGITRQAISQYENGNREPKLETWQKLAKLFNVTVPYLQGIDDKPNNGYPKEYIYKCLDDAYKNMWIGKSDLIGVSFIPALYVEKYCNQNKISIPKNVDLNFWKTNFSFIFDYPEIKRLITTKDKYSDEDIKELISIVLFQKTTNKKLVSFIEKLNTQYLKNLQNKNLQNKKEKLSAQYLKNLQNKKME